MGCTLSAMPTGSIREFADDTGNSFRTVYRRAKKGDFRYPNAELLTEERKVYRVRWKKTKAKKVK